jgi:hypothetical protein
MSARIAWAFAALLDGHRPPQASSREISRLRRRADTLTFTRVGRADTIASWLADRARVHHYSVAPPDTADLRVDPRIALSGVSAPSSGLSAGGEVEGYVHADHLDALEREYLLVPKPDHTAAAANVVLRTLGPPAAHTVAGIPRMMLIADLLDRYDPRATSAAEHLLDQVLDQRLWLS